MTYEITIFFNWKDENENIYLNAASRSTKYMPNLFFLKENRLFYRRKDNESWKEIKTKCLIKDDLKNISNYIEEIIKISHENAHLIKVKFCELEPVGILKRESSYTQFFYSELCYSWEKKNKNILQIIIDVTYNIIKNHYFTNGNKRIALSTMFFFIKKIGLKLMHDEREKDISTEAINDWLKLFRKIAKSNRDSKDVLKNEIYEKLLGKLVLNIDSIN